MIKPIHIGGLIPRLRVERDGTAVVVNQTRAVFLEETEHGRSSRLRGIKPFTTGL
jgi:hypothetical protein